MEHRQTVLGRDADRPARPALAGLAAAVHNGTGKRDADFDRLRRPNALDCRPGLDVAAVELGEDVIIHRVMLAARREKDRQRPDGPGLLLALVVAPAAAVLAVALLLVLDAGSFAVLGLAAAPLVVLWRVGLGGMSSNTSAALAALSTIVVPMVFGALVVAMALVYGLFMQSFN